jgi:alkylation response protein AidB-like acyl-CoA dehydrogenase
VKHLLRRLLDLFRMRVQALRRRGDPVQALEGLYGRQAGLLEEAQRAALEVAAARRRLEYRLRDLQQPQLRREAVSVKAQIRMLRAEEKKLRTAMDAAAADLRRARAEVDMLQTSYAVALAKLTLAEAQAELDDEAVELQLIIEKAHSRVIEAQSRAAALEALAPLPFSSAEGPPPQAGRRHPA